MEKPKVKVWRPRKGSENSYKFHSLAVVVVVVVVVVMSSGWVEVPLALAVIFCAG